jgi:hypothetical protein
MQTAATPFILPPSALLSLSLSLSLCFAYSYSLALSFGRHITEFAKVHKTQARVCTHALLSISREIRLARLGARDK